MALHRCPENYDNQLQCNDAHTIQATAPKKKNLPTKKNWQRK